jgi:hypothetical protein
VSERLQIAFITGQSDPRSCALSAAQTTFLRNLPLPEPAKVYANFPYDEQTPKPRDVHLAIASWNNTWQSFLALFPGFAWRYRARVVALVERADRTVFLAGSCGIHILRGLRLPERTLRRVAVFAYGPVAFGRPPCRHVLVGSTGDRISRAFFAHPDVVVTSDHLRYLEDPALAAACLSFLASLDRDD